MKNAVLFVPHPDDELLVGGGMLYALAHSADWCVKVVFVTNGDYYAHEAEIRLKEAINACKSIGIQESDVLFLGYGDGWEEKHIYNSIGTCVSHAGKMGTYGLESHADYAYQRHGTHHSYTKKNLEEDIKEIIVDNFPQLLLCVDFDTHPDHRALSLVFTEVIREILVECENYKPLILKKLAYENVMRGRNDYYHIPHLPTYSENNNLASTPVLKWDSRICFKVPSVCNSIRLSQNPLYKAAVKYKSQRIKLRMTSALNADIVFWRLPSENRAIQAQIKVSSNIGGGGYINDLKIIDSDDLNQRHCVLDCGVWKPDEKDITKTVKLSWNKSILVNFIVFFENPSLNSNINRIKIAFNGENPIFYTNIKHDGSANIIYLDTPKYVSTLELCILDGTQGCGLSEVMVFDKIKALEEYELPLELLDNNKMYTKKYNIYEQIISTIDRYRMTFVKITTILWSSKYVLMRHYPICRNKGYLIPICRIYHWFKQGLNLLKGKTAI